MWRWSTCIEQDTDKNKLSDKIEKKCDTFGTVPESNRKIVERDKKKVLACINT
jgi:hypothetical protein